MDLPLRMTFPVFSCIHEPLSLSQCVGSLVHFRRLARVSKSFTTIGDHTWRVKHRVWIEGIKEQVASSCRGRTLQ